MDEFPGLLGRDFGFKPQGKSAPMSASKGVVSPTTTGSARSGPGGNPPPPGGYYYGGAGLFGVGQQNHQLHRHHDDDDDGDIFFSGGGGPPKYTTNNAPSSAFSYDPFFQGFQDHHHGAKKSPPPPSSSSMPMYDKPVYDDDDGIFNGIHDMKNSAFVKHEDVFASAASNHTSSPPYDDDLLANLGRTEAVPKGSSDQRSGEPTEQDIPGFDDLIPGFGGSSPPQKSGLPESNRQQSSVPSTKSPANMTEDPFVVLESTSVPAYSSSEFFTDPLEHINMSSGSMTSDVSSSRVGGFDDINAFDGLMESVPSFSSGMKNNPKDRSPLETVQKARPGHPTFGKEPADESSVKTFENALPRTAAVDNHRDSQSHQTLFDMPTKSSDSVKYVRRSGAPTSDANVNPCEANVKVGMFQKSEAHSIAADEVWLTVSEIPLFTQPTSAPPPSRPPPAFVIKQALFANTDKDASVGLTARRKVNESSFPQSTESYMISKSRNDMLKTSAASSIDELEDFAMGKPQAHADEHEEALSSEEDTETNSAAAASAAAMKEAMDRAEAKFKHAREVRERERDLRSAKNRETAQHGRDENAVLDAQDQELEEKQESLYSEREHEEREEKEKEQKRLEKEREREFEREREKARQAVERANREARERAAAEARQKAERAARERAERAAVQRAAAEVRERAAAEAKERAEKLAAEARARVDAEARERAAAEAREKAAVEARERAAVGRAAAEVRARAQRAAVERAAAEARERAAAMAREKQYKNENENDLDSFFGMGGRANSAPKQRASTYDSTYDTPVQNKGSSDGVRRTYAGSSSSIRKASSTTNITDDLASIFGAAPSFGEFQEIEGETEERRRARLERQQRTHERAAKALAEKNERDIQTQREQAERHRIGETLDIEIKRWAAGKEGNLRALLSTLQYVLWPECGWQPVSLTDLITSVSVKKVYRKANLCIHPDKVQQKGANLQQKYVAEKVFDLLKEAWNKFNSEELF